MDLRDRFPVEGERDPFDELFRSLWDDSAWPFGVSDGTNVHGALRYEPHEVTVKGIVFTLEESGGSGEHAFAFSACLDDQGARWRLWLDPRHRKPILAMQFMTAVDEPECNHVIEGRLEP